ncbi:uncharacterized protein N7496_011445 [Penicillium cataractarum]|uniref:Uncharacterized protein n=1 Tax=Penicillium cataractarum TaxID=2100454 RepID=A0A9W9RF15_9EURO|nr:uncharacterized protein N7496_011445 [Penicillium cataractarum]KAJ5359032.1 hypothetical protein N7496_011445 [Penicillium cataractarum]
MTTSFANPDSLAELSALVERTVQLPSSAPKMDPRDSATAERATDNETQLIDTGRLFRKSNSMAASTHIQRSIPVYYDGFQNALDNLSEQIFIAKAFLEKDYEAIKAREVVPQPAEDVSMSEIKQKIEPDLQPSTLEQTDLASRPLKVEPPSDESAMAGLSLPTEAIPAPQPSEPLLKTEEKDTGGLAVTDQTFPGTEGIQFDTVLDESGATNSFDLNYDFGNDDMGNQAFLSGTGFGSTTTGTDNPATSLPPTDNATAAPAGGGAFDMELGKTEGANAFPDPGTGMEDMMGPGESSFDDLFMENENFGETAGDLHQLEGDSLMEINELDDSWFN